ncbi:MAG: AMP-binding protein [Olegusella sp.]|nr:AMP-binding protein [Olegusella sp.]
MAGSEGMTGYPSVDKPWLKYYSEEAINAPLPECTIFEYLQKNNQDHPDDVAIIYFSRKITYRELFENIEKTAKAFCSLGVKPGEIVTIALPSIPEALYAVYALNRLGAVANMVHPLAGRGELLSYLDEVGTRVAVLFDGTCDVLGDSLGETGVEHAVVISAAESLPLGLKVLYRLKNRGRSTVNNSRHLSWKQFVEGGRNIVPYYVSKDVDAVAIISHTGGTTGEPKGVMLSDRNTNAIICQVGAALPHTDARRGCL